MLPVITSGVDSVALEKDEGTLAGVKGVAAVGATGLFQGFVFLDGARGMGEAEASKTSRGGVVGPAAPQHQCAWCGLGVHVRDHSRQSSGFIWGAVVIRHSCKRCMLMCQPSTARGTA